MNFTTPYRIVGGVRFYERKEVKDVIAYLRVIHNPLDSVSLKRIINVPTRGIGASTMGVLEAQAAERDVPLGDVVREAHLVSVLMPGAKNAIVSFASLLLRLQEMREKLTVTQLTEAVIRESGYAKELEDA